MNAELSPGIRKAETLHKASDPSRRIAIARISPSVDAGSYPVRRCCGD